MHGVPTLAAMREAHAALAAQGIVPRALGIMFCQECGTRRAFVSHDAHSSHITDAGCEACGFVYGRIDIIETRRGAPQPDGTAREVVATPPKKRVPVISERVAAEAAAALKAARSGGTRQDEAPRPMPAMPPDDAGSDESRVTSYLRGQR